MVVDGDLLAQNQTFLSTKPTCVRLDPRLQVGLLIESSATRSIVAKFKISAFMLILEIKNVSKTCFLAALIKKCDFFVVLCIYECSDFIKR